MTADTRQVVITRDVTWKTLGTANEFQSDKGMSRADTSRGGASAAEGSVRNDSEQGELASSQEAGTTLLEVEWQCPKNGDRATATNIEDVQDGAANGEQSAEIPAGLPNHIGADDVGESALHVDSPLKGRSDPAQDFSEPSTDVEPGET